jgi:hypothetical protein
MFIVYVYIHIVYILALCLCFGPETSGNFQHTVVLYFYANRQLISLNIYQGGKCFFDIVERDIYLRYTFFVNCNWFRDKRWTPQNCYAVRTFPCLNVQLGFSEPARNLPKMLIDVNNKHRGLSPRANYTDRTTTASAKLVPAFADRGCYSR